MRCRSVTVVSLAAAVTAAAAWSQSTPAPGCQPTGSIMRLEGLPEASGLALSRATPGRLWAHNDSGKAEIFAIDAKGNITGRVSITGATVVDWEAMASASCGAGACLYIADIGDNGADRKEIMIYRLPEPTQPAGTAAVDAAVRAIYPDGAQDAETLLAAADGTLYIVTKGETGPVALYRVPRDGGGGVVRMERVGAPLAPKGAAEDARVTDGSISPDGGWVALRTRTSLTFHRTADFLKGNFREARRVDLTSLREPQGEGVALDSATTVYLAGEGGGLSRSGTLAVLNCPR
jgi:hypothetical protein